jgi:uncharacterized membrane protein
MKRIQSIDFTRGLVMIIMALDHVRDLIHVDSLSQSPTDLNTTSPILFFTRWITHLCAPVFVFLAGTSAFISFQKKKDTRQFRNGLFKRGLWLIFLEFTFVNFAIYFDPGFHTPLFAVIAAIGMGFIFLGLMLSFSLRTIGIIAVVILLFHNLTPLIPFPEGSVLKTILTPFFQPAAFPIGSGRTFIMGYPPIPWLGIMLLGFAMGKVFLTEGINRRKLFIKTGLGLIVFFTILRFINVYGDPVNWSAQKSSVYTFLSFMNVSKYPPSLMFCSVTLGIMFLILAVSESSKGRFINFAKVYGQVPLFYFVLHFYLVHIILIFVLFLQGFSWADLDFASGTFGRPKGMETGLSLSWIYLIWICVVLALYKPCQWFGKFKSDHNYWWLKYL